MDVAAIARAQALNRVAMGAGLLLVPRVLARVWTGPWAADQRATVAARALGARDLMLGLCGVLADREGDAVWIRRSFAAQAFADAVDFVAIVAGRRHLPLSSRALGAPLAAGSAAVAGAYAFGVGIR
jgi:hypothetical protein